MKTAEIESWLENNPGVSYRIAKNLKTTRGYVSMILTAYRTGKPRKDGFVRRRVLDALRSAGAPLPPQK